MANGEIDSGLTGHSYRVLRHRDYTLLWSAEALSTLGTQIQRVAVAWQVYQLTDSPFKLGLIGLFRFVPIILFGLYGGVLADRGDRRRTLLWTQLVLMLVSGALAALTYSGDIRLWMIYGAVVAGAIVEGISNPTRQALIPLMVPRRELPAAVTMNQLSHNTAAVIGPAIGGFIIGYVSVSAAYFVDAISFTAVMAAVLLMHIRPQRIPITMSGFAAALEGLQFLKKTPVLLGVMFTDFVATFFGASTSLMPIFAQDVLGVGAQGLGILLAAPAAGAVATAFIMSVVKLPDRAGTWVLGSIFIYGLALIGFGLSTFFIVSLAMLAISGAADAISTTLRNSMRQIMTPDQLMGRVAAVHRTLAVGGPQLGEFEAGILASLTSASTAVAFGGIATAATAVIVSQMIRGIPRFRFTTAVVPVYEDAMDVRAS